MKIKIDVTHVHTFSKGNVQEIILPSLFTIKTAKDYLKDLYFKGDKFKIIELERKRNITIPVIGDSVTQSIYEYFDNSVIVGVDDSMLEEYESEVE